MYNKYPNYRKVMAYFIAALIKRRKKSNMFKGMKMTIINLLIITDQYHCSSTDDIKLYSQFFNLVTFISLFF